MKVKELCEMIDEQQDISVCHNNKDLDGGYPCDFLDCELVVKRISVVACEVILSAPWVSIYTGSKFDQKSKESNYKTNRMESRTVLILSKLYR